MNFWGVETMFHLWLTFWNKLTSQFRFDTPSSMCTRESDFGMLENLNENKTHWVFSCLDTDWGACSPPARLLSQGASLLGPPVLSFPAHEPCKTWCMFDDYSTCLYYDHSTCMYYDHSTVYTCTCMYYDHSICMYYDHVRCLYYDHSGRMYFDRSTCMYFDRSTCMYHDHSTCTYYYHSMCMYYGHSTCMYYDPSTRMYYDHSTCITFCMAHVRRNEGREVRGPTPWGKHRVWGAARPLNAWCRNHFHRCVASPIHFLPLPLSYMKAPFTLNRRYGSDANGRWFMIQGPVTTALTVRLQSVADIKSAITCQYSYDSISPCPQTPIGCSAYNASEVQSELQAWSCQAHAVHPDADTALAFLLGALSIPESYHGNGVVRILVISIFFA